MKRVSALFVAVMIAVFSIPQLRVHAESSGVVGFYTQESIGTVFSDSTLQEDLDLVIMTNQTFDEAGFLNFLEANVDIPENHFITCSVGNGYAVTVFDLTDVQGFTYFSATNTSFRGSFFGMDEEWEETYDIPYASYYIYTDHIDGPYNGSNSCTDFYPWGTNVGKANLGSGYLLHSTVPVFSLEQAISLGCPTTISGAGSDTNQNVWMVQNYTSLTDIRGSGAVYNGSEIIDPSTPDVEIEDISNHLYAKNFDVFFCNTRQLMSNPYGMANIGGGYLCVKYDLDDYARANIGKLVLSFNYSCSFGESVYTGAYQGRLDSSGYVIIPINQAFQNNPYFMAKYDMVLATSKNTFYQDFCEMKPYYFTRTQWNDYKEVYQDYLPGGIDGTPQEHQLTAQKLEDILSNSPFVYMVDKYENIDVPTLPASAVVMKNLGYVLDGKVEIYSPDVSVAKFDCVCKLMNEGDIFETSGEFKKTINFKTGVSSITDNGITVNPNPFDGTGTYDIVPSDSEYGIVSSGGTAYATVGNIVNQITFPGYKELKADIDSNPDGNFTQFLAPFYNNEVGAWFFSFVDDMPPEMKAILISGCGVGVLFGIARYVRRS